MVETAFEVALAWVEMELVVVLAPGVELASEFALGVA